MADKTLSQTYQQLVEQQNIKNILDQPNTTLKNKRGVFKERHNGLTIKISNNVLTTNEPINENGANALDNQSSQTQIVSTEKATKTEEIDKKSTDVLTQYSYNSLTILEDKKIRKLRKKIFLWEEDLQNNLKQKENWEQEIKENNGKNKVLDDELADLEDELIDIEADNETKENNQNLNLDYLNKLYFHNQKIKDIKREMAKIQKRNKDLSKEIESITFKNNDLESNISQLKEKLKQHIYEFGMHSTLAAAWIKKSDEIILLHQKVQNVTTEKEFNKIRQKIEKLDNEMKEIWDGKKIEKIFEEILPINDKLYFITTFQHADNSITEKIMHLQQLTNGDIHVVNQIKTFANINEYKKDKVTIEDISINNNIQFMPIKDF